MPFAVHVEDLAFMFFLTKNVLQPRGCPEAWKCTEGPRVMGTHAYIISRGYALDCTGVVYNSIYNIHKRNVECTWVGLPDEKHGMYFVRIPRFPRNDGMTCLNLHRNKIHAINTHTPHIDNENFTAVYESTPL